MDDIITQEELDALYGAIEQATRKAVAQAGREGEPEEQTVQLYDFRVAHRFPQEQVRQLQRQFRGFERLCNANLSTFLRCPVQITLASVDQMGYSEYVASIPQITVLYVLDEQGLGGTLLFEMNSNVALGMMDRLLGGPGYILSEGRALTDMERSLVNQVVAQILRSLRETWLDLAPLQLKMSGVESDPRAAYALPLNASLLVLTFEVQLRKTYGTMTLALSEALVQRLAQALENRQRALQTSNESLATQQLLQGLDEVYANVTVSLGSAELTLEEFENLQVDDVVVLNASVERPLSVQVGGQEKFRGALGRSGEQFAVQVTEVVQGEGN